MTNRMRATAGGHSPYTPDPPMAQLTPSTEDTPEVENPTVEEDETPEEAPTSGDAPSYVENPTVGETDPEYLDRIAYAFDLLAGAASEMEDGPQKNALVALVILMESQHHAIGTIGAQQQYVTDMVTAALAQFNTMFANSGGNPLAMMKSLLFPGRKTIDG